ncbi:MAG: YkgJ family cysteine cluster protein [Chitinispirillaceae bacterium]|nr:YkgJ family cysteine cluster protein [Chitinispirillaceae bacterium]
MKRKTRLKKSKERTPPCRDCNGLCCRHIALEIDTPKTRIDFDTIRWYLMHETVQVGIDHDGEWLIEVPVVCRHLKNNGCAIYDKRPNICREYPGKEGRCEHEDKTSPYKVLFCNEATFERYCAGKRKRQLPRPDRCQPSAHGTHAIGPHLP